MIERDANDLWNETDTQSNMLAAPAKYMLFAKAIKQLIFVDIVSVGLELLKAKSVPQQASCHSSAF